MQATVVWLHSQPLLPRAAARNPYRDIPETDVLWQPSLYHATIFNALLSITCN